CPEELAIRSFMAVSERMNGEDGLQWRFVPPDDFDPTSLSWPGERSSVLATGNAAGLVELGDFVFSDVGAASLPASAASVSAWEARAINEASAGWAPSQVTLPCSRS